MKRFFVSAVAVLGLGFPLRASNLLVNGSFELGDFVPTEPGFMVLSSGATAMTGWTVTGNGLGWDSAPNPDGLTASDGSYFLDLTSDYDTSPYGGVQQTVATTIGLQYQLTFDVGTDLNFDSDEGSFPAIPVGIQATAGSSSGTFTTTTPVAHDQWQSFTFDFTATSTSTAITLTGQASRNIQYLGLDNVDLEAAPEPGTLVLLAIPGLLAIAAHRRLRKT